MYPGWGLTSSRAAMPGFLGGQQQQQTLEGSKCYTITHRIKATTEASGPEMSKTRGNKDPEHLICDQQRSSREDQSFYLIFLSPCPEIQIQKGESCTSLVVQWLRIDLPMQETQVQSLVSFHTPQSN